MEIMFFILSILSLMLVIYYRWPRLRVGYLLKPQEKLFNPFLYVIITNHGHAIRFIKKPKLLIHPGGEKMYYFDDLNVCDISPQSFPYRLEPNEEFNKVVPLSELDKKLLSGLKPKSSVQIVAQDNSGKFYYSNKIQVSSLTDFIAECQKQKC